MCFCIGLHLFFEFCQLGAKKSTVRLPITNSSPDIEVILTTQGKLNAAVEPETFTAYPILTEVNLIPVFRIKFLN